MDAREQLAEGLRRAYRRVRLAPMAYAAATGTLFSGRTPDVTHLASFPEEDAWGPLQRDEALLLYAVVRAKRPRTVVEFGFHLGHSAFNFLRAMDADATLFSFDVDPGCVRIARDYFGHDPRLRFTLKSQDAVTAADVDGRPIDLLFIDASHDLPLNQRTFAAVAPLLAPDALVAVHDTGAWAADRLPRNPRAAAHVAAGGTGHWLDGGGYAHQPGERAFVNWVVAEQEGFQAVHFHTDRVFRHGLTLLQRGGPLEV